MSYPLPISCVGCGETDARTSVGGLFCLDCLEVSHIRLLPDVCPHPGCSDKLQPDPETPVLRCPTHGPVRHKPGHL